MDARTRKIIEEQKDPRILQALLTQAIEFIEMQKGVIEEIQAANAQKAQSMFGLEERVKLLVRSLFAKKSEKRNEATDRPSRQKPGRSTSLLASHVSNA
jgi:hypothetical protein